MKASTQKMIDQIDQNHDFADTQTRSSGGTHYYNRTTCLVCGLERSWFTDSQNGIGDTYEFSRHGERISLRDALEC